MNMNCKSIKKIALIFILFYLTENAFAQVKPLTSSEIYTSIQKLNTVGNALYVAAHPDDENTLLISWLSKEKKVRTAYMALTRGDGGQNLIGPEQNEYVGLLRTHELLEARKIDGGEQYFSRAVDFGFTKQTDEALATWGKEQILEDLVYRIRKFKPDVILNRFPPDARAGHGHHSASAELSIEAFDAAADPAVFPDQVKELGVWQAKRLVWNSFNRGFTNTSPEDGNYVRFPLGDFNSLLGKSYTEIAAEARSKHRSQGFGSAPTRNERFDYAVLIKGSIVKNDIFEDIDITWNRVNGGKKIDESLKAVLASFDFTNPSKSTKALIKIYIDMELLPENHFKENKLSECLNLILVTSGIYLEANAQQYSVSPSENLKIFFTAVNRSTFSVNLKSVNISGISSKDTTFTKTLEYNKAFENSFDLKIPADAKISQPYWLEKKAEKGLYQIQDKALTGLPMNPAKLNANFLIEILGETFTFSHPIRYKYTEPSRGEIYKYLEIRPKVMVNIDQKVYIFADKTSKKISVTAKSNIAGITANIGLNVPAGWTISPKEISITFKEKNQDKKAEFDLIPPAKSSEVEIEAYAKINDLTLNRGLKTVSYEHIPELNTFPIASAMVKKIEIQKKGTKIGYIAGAGDDVPDALKQIGYDVQMLTEKNLSGDLQKFDVIMVGVRAYNTEDWLVNAQELLLNYAKNGGRLIVQYQTQAFYGTVKTKEMGPYPLTVGRGRVTDENAEMRILNPAEPLLSFPNKINANDFTGWVQERGLYFAEKWDPNYKSVFAIKDKGETEQEGSLLYTPYGKGYYVFTSLAFFRQLPAGVPGAFRLMANIISIGKK
jgi:LmbE family N-acetylglucosaminyl deacetylase